MKKIGICGHFAEGKTLYNGQTIKTINVSNEILKKYSIENVIKVDTYNWKKNPLVLFFKCLKIAKNCGDIIIFPAQNGIKIFIPLFVILKKFFKFKLHYVVIGGWLPSLIQNNHYINEKMKKVDHIYIENYKMVEELKKIGINNAVQMNNFKNLNISHKKYDYRGKSLKCCIFSRIEEMKGITEAIDVVEKLHEEYNKIISLDIYGKINDNYECKFFEKIKGKEDYIKYCGIIDSNKSVETIENYDLLLFPTKYYTEGIPGTIIDAYFSKVPVLASKWENFDEIVDEGITGIGFQFGDTQDFFDKLLYIFDNKILLNNMKDKCGEKARNYTSHESMKILFENIGD